MFIGNIGSSLYRRFATSLSKHAPSVGMLTAFAVAAIYAGARYLRGENSTSLAATVAPLQEGLPAASTAPSQSNAVQTAGSESNSNSSNDWVNEYAGTSGTPAVVVESTLPTPALRSFEERLNDWVNEGGIYRSDRQMAAEKILHCKRQNCRDLDLNYLRIGALPECLSEMEQVGLICIKSCGIKELRSESLPRNLRVIFAPHNEISSIDLRNRKKIEVINLDYNELVSIKSEFLPKEVLETLTACKNKLVEANLTDHLLLRHLNLSQNKLSGILNFSSLKYLGMVELQDNDLSSFPIFYREISIFHLDLRGNPITIFPADERLPQVNFYNGPLPTSEAGRERLNVGAALATKPAGVFISPVAFFRDISPQIGLAKLSHGAVIGTKLPRFIKHLGGKPVSISLDTPAAIDNQQLSTQVQNTISALRRTQKSIPVVLLEEAAPESPIGKIRTFAEKEIKKVQGLILPGGPNIETEFYKENAVFSPNTSYARTVTEFALVLAAKKQGKPVYGICRGAQLLNVLFGGTLKNQGQGGWLSVEVAESSYKQKIVELLEGDSMPAFSAHHQCCDRIAKGFEVVMKSGTIPKFIMNAQNKIFGSQVHLEEMWDGQYSVGYRMLQFFCQAVPVEQSLRSRL